MIDFTKKFIRNVNLVDLQFFKMIKWLELLFRFIKKVGGICSQLFSVSPDAGKNELENSEKFPRLWQFLTKSRDVLPEPSDHTDVSSLKKSNAPSKFSREIFALSFNLYL